MVNSNLKTKNHRRSNKTKSRKQAKEISFDSQSLTNTKLANLQ